MDSIAQTTPRAGDWPWHKVLYELAEAGWTISALAARHKRNRTIYSHIRRLPMPKAQAEIAAAIGLSPLAIWPTRYEVDGKPVSTVAWLRARGLPVVAGCRGYQPRKRAAEREIAPLERDQ